MTVKIVMTINNKDFVISLKQNKATNALIKQLPLTMTMKDLNGNEKYHYIQKHLPTETEFIEKIEAGDFMLFGDNCLVFFYKSFSTHYSYTKLGRIEDVEGYLKVINQSSDINISLHQ
ncbi:cyclophilin-like fold protein [Sharpea azabuensis]|uniref:cyclophilin-like fold protein n=1 Tax=Sharpea azabuensis TaxID=322505 RepID=UPI0024093556|nr:cyclophilin-like fold protein [Sharpea azabuensis]MDD6513691.1 cyclophilin-like fold protein [Sharpea azabuensis]